MAKNYEMLLDDYALNDVIDVSDFKIGTKQNLRKIHIQKSDVKVSSDFELTLPNTEADVFKEIGFITDFEGHFKFLNPEFLSKNKITDSSFSGRSLIDCIHPEDLPSSIEFLIKFIQGDTSFITFQTRIAFVENVYKNLRWKVACSGQLLFFTISENEISLDVSQQELRKDTLEDLYFDTIYWKMEVSNSIKDWDQIVLPYIDSCIEIKSNDNTL